LGIGPNPQSPIPIPNPQSPNKKLNNSDYLRKYITNKLDI